ncbi:DNA mismatch repair protein MSH7 [Tanacetum coccineum]
MLLKTLSLFFDELGRGTSTFDGYAIIAYAVFRHLVEKVKGVDYYTSQSTNQQLVFLYRLANGAWRESYGLQVASMAGIPKKVVEAAAKAAEVMKTKIRVSFRSSERRSEFSTLHEEWLKSVLAMSRVDDHKLVGGEEDDVFDELFCLWHELKCSNKKLM